MNSIKSIIAIGLLLQPLAVYAASNDNPSIKETESKALALLIKAAPWALVVYCGITLKQENNQLKKELAAINVKQNESTTTLGELGAKAAHYFGIANDDKNPGKINMMDQSLIAVSNVVKDLQGMLITNNNNPAPQQPVPVVPAPTQAPASTTPIKVTAKPDQQPSSQEKIDTTAEKPADLGASDTAEFEKVPGDGDTTAKK